MLQRRRHAKPYSLKQPYLNRTKSYKIVCAVCGNGIIVQVLPPLIKNVVYEVLQKIEV